MASSTSLLSTSSSGSGTMMRGGRCFDTSGTTSGLALGPRCDLKAGARAKLLFGRASSSEVGGVTVDAVVELESFVVVLLAMEGVGDLSLRCLRGGDGNDISTPRPENRNSDCSQVDFGIDGDGAGCRWALAAGKKSSKVSPSAPVSTTRRESLFLSATSLGG